MIICKTDDEVREAIANNEPEIGIKLIDNASNAIWGGFLMGWTGAMLSQQRNTTPGMQEILREAGYKYKETSFVFFHGKVMFYVSPNATNSNNESSDHFEALD